MKILMITSYFYPIIAGSELFVWEVSQRLVKLGHEVHVLTKNGHSEYKKNLPEYEQCKGIHIHRVPFIDLNQLRSFSAIPGFILKGNEIIKKFEIDSVHAHVTYPNAWIGWVLKKLNKIPLITTIQGDELFDYPEFDLLKFIKPGIISALKASDKVHAVSVALKDSVVNEGVNAENVVIIPNGVNTKTFSKEFVKGNKRKELGLEKKFVAITASRLSIKNGVDDLIKAWRKVVDKNKESVLLICGTGPDEKALKDLTKELKLEKNVNFLGYIEHDSELPKYFKASNVFVRPSITEGFGIVFVESMSMEMPTIGTAVGGIVDIIQDRENGLFVKPRNPESIANGLIEIMEDKKLAEKISVNGRKTALEKFDWDSIATKVEWLYKSTV